MDTRDPIDVVSRGNAPRRRESSRISVGPRHLCILPVCYRHPPHVSAKNRQARLHVRYQVLGCVGYRLDNVGEPLARV